MLPNISAPVFPLPDGISTKYVDSTSPPHEYFESRRDSVLNYLKTLLMKTHSHASFLQHRSYKPYYTLESNQNSSFYSLTVSTFNTLASSLSGEHPNLGNFSRIDRKTLEFSSFRGILLLYEILQSDSDIICLQEVDTYSNWFQNVLKWAGYDSQFQPKVPSPCEKYTGRSDGLVLAWRIIPRMEQQQLQHQQKYILCPISVDSVQRLKYSGERSQVAFVTGFEFVHETDRIQSKHGFILCGTHLKSEKSENGERIRQVQAKELILAARKLRKFVEQNYSVELLGEFIIGDMNARPNSFGGYAPLVYEAFLTDGFYTCAYEPLPVMESEAESGLFTSHKFRETNGREVETKTWIDYIFYRIQDECAVYSILELIESVPNGLPCVNYPSDHILLAANFKLTPRR
mmetsp:Transcript_12139/g.21946  ORF Transcript_12139/g.21946 Transcript_12139/m.21946 type:complete len:403 (-) Transcript_12139:850-2058(-)